MARALGEAGAQVLIAGSNAEHLHKACEALCSDDLHSSRSLETRGCRPSLRDHALIDILINIVGGRRINTPTEDLALEDWQRIIDLNLT